MCSWVMVFINSAKLPFFIGIPRSNDTNDVKAQLIPFLLSFEVTHIYREK